MTQVQGLAAFEARMSAIPRRVREAVRMELERNAREIVDDMKRLVPVKTGELRDSIGWTWGAAPTGSVTIGRVGSNDYGTMRITIYAGGAESTARQQRRASGARRSDQGRSGTFEADIARYQEFGTTKMAANPFFFPVWRARKQRTKTRITRAIRKAIKDT